MNIFAKTSSEKQAVKDAKKAWKLSIMNKFPELAAQGYSAMQIWKKNLQINTKLN